MRKLSRLQILVLGMQLGKKAQNLWNLVSLAMPCLDEHTYVGYGDENTYEFHDHHLGEVGFNPKRTPEKEKSCHKTLIDSFGGAGASQMPDRASIGATIQLVAQS